MGLKNHSQKATLNSVPTRNQHFVIVRRLKLSNEANGGINGISADDGR
jgi:hypothetical protein